MIVSSDKKRRPDRKKLAKRGLNAKCTLNALKMKVSIYHLRKFLI